MNDSFKRVKICFVGPKAYPLFNPDIKELFGGAEVDLYYIATELAKDNNFDVSFITADYGQNDTEVAEGVKIIKSLNFKKNPFGGAIKVWRAMRKANADMYMIKSISPGMFLVAFFCRIHKKNFLYRTAHSTHCDGTYLRLHPLRGKIFKSALKTAKVIFAQNETDKQQLKLTAGADSIALPNGHRLDKFLQEKKRDTILWVGRSEEFKRPQLFIELAQKTPNEKFTMICQRGTGDNSYEKLVSQAKEVSNLKFIQQVPFSMVDSYFQQAKVFVNTSDVEGFPNTFIQACKVATPILSLDVNPDGFLDKYNCGICCNGDWQHFKDSLVHMLEDKNYAELGRNARKYVEQHHDITKIVEQYKRLFVELTE